MLIATMSRKVRWATLFEHNYFMAGPGAQDHGPRASDTGPLVLGPWIHWTGVLLGASYKSSTALFLSYTSIIKN